MSLIYTGIGSRETPPDILAKMEEFAYRHAKLGYTLRSGGAEGADTAFELGCDRGAGKKEIYLPWYNFNNNKSPLYNIPQWAFKMAEKFHPNWHSLALPVKKLHARNCMQVLGANGDSPSNFILCYTKDGKLGGGTSQALRIAATYNIKIINLGSVEQV